MTGGSASGRPEEDDKHGGGHVSGPLVSGGARGRLSTDDGCPTPKCWSESKACEIDEQPVSACGMRMEVVETREEDSDSGSGGENGCTVQLSRPTQARDASMEERLRDEGWKDNWERPMEEGCVANRRHGGCDGCQIESNDVARRGHWCLH